MPLPSFLKSPDPRKAIAERFKDAPASEWQAQMPVAQFDSIDNTTLILCGGLLTGLLHADAHSFPVEAEKLYREGRGWRTLARRCPPDAVLRGQRGRHRGGLPRRGPRRPDEAGRRSGTADGVFMLGYSKGAPDILSFLIHHPEYHEQIKGVFTWGGAMGGSYTADGVYEQIKNLPTEGSFEYVSTLLAVITGTMLSRQACAASTSTTSRAR